MQELHFSTHSSSCCMQSFDERQPAPDELWTAIFSGVPGTSELFEPPMLNHLLAAEVDHARQELGNAIFLGASSHPNQQPSTGAGECDESIPALGYLQASTGSAHYELAPVVAAAALQQPRGLHAKQSEGYCPNRMLQNVQPPGLQMPDGPAAMQYKQLSHHQLPPQLRLQTAVKQCSPQGWQRSFKSARKLLCSDNASGRPTVAERLRHCGQLLQQHQQQQPGFILTQQPEFKLSFPQEADLPQLPDDVAIFIGPASKFKPSAYLYNSGGSSIRPKKDPDIMAHLGPATMNASDTSSPDLETVLAFHSYNTRCRGGHQKKPECLERHVVDSVRRLKLAMKSISHDNGKGALAFQLQFCSVDYAVYEVRLAAGKQLERKARQSASKSKRSQSSSAMEQPPLQRRCTEEPEDSGEGGAWSPAQTSKDSLSQRFLQELSVPWPLMCANTAPAAIFGNDTKEEKQFGYRASMIRPHCSSGRDNVHEQRFSVTCSLTGGSEANGRASSDGYGSSAPVPASGGSRGCAVFSSLVSSNEQPIVPDTGDMTVDNTTVPAQTALDVLLFALHLPPLVAPSLNEQHDIIRQLNANLASMTIQQLLGCLQPCLTQMAQMPQPLHLLRQPPPPTLPPQPNDMAFGPL